jgi:hypothetical protein
VCVCVCVCVRVCVCVCECECVCHLPVQASLHAVRQLELVAPQFGLADEIKAEYWAELAQLLQLEQADATFPTADYEAAKDGGFPLLVRHHDLVHACVCVCVCVCASCSTPRPLMQSFHCN